MPSANISYDKYTYTIPPVAANTTYSLSITNAVPSFAKPMVMVQYISITVQTADPFEFQIVEILQDSTQSDLYSTAPNLTASYIDSQPFTIVKENSANGLTFNFINQSTNIISNAQLVIVATGA